MTDQEDDAPFRGEYVDFAELDRAQLQSKLLELLTLVETSRELLRANDADDMARRVLLSAIGVLGASSACILQLGPARVELILTQQFGLDLELGARFPLRDGMIQRFEEEASARPFRADRELVEAPAASFLHSHPEFLRATEADLIAPLLGRSGLVGFFVLGRRLLTEGYGVRDIELFASLSDLYALAIEREASPAPSATHRPRVLGDSASLTEPPRTDASSFAAAPTFREVRDVAAELARLREAHPPLRSIMGESAAMLELFEELVAFADSRATILIQGESGTGKELIAKAIHQMSRRRSRPLEIVDCSSIPKELIESELFGHLRGAFTGAVRDRRGAFELAHTGTLFLDEIGEMTLASQTRLLRALQEGKFRPVGGEKTRSVDVRFIAATNVDLREAARAGDFRKDLFYRIQVFPLRLPPLRERDGDIDVLTRAFLKRFYADEGLPEPRVEDEVFLRLRGHSFPGNVRELQNMTEALAIRSRGEGAVRAEHLDEVWRSQRIPDGEQAERVARRSPRSKEAGKIVHAPKSSGESLLRAWREAGFNLLEASRQLRARRNEGEPIGVVDRAQLSHYLDGEILQGFYECGDLSLCVERLTAGHRLAHRGEKRIHRVLGELLEASETEHDAFPRLPEEYRDALDALLKLGPRWLRKRLHRTGEAGF